MTKLELEQACLELLKKQGFSNAHILIKQYNISKKSLETLYNKLNK